MRKEATYSLLHTYMWPIMLSHTGKVMWVIMFALNLTNLSQLQNGKTELRR